MSEHGDTDPEEIEQDWIEPEFHPYDANRYDPEKDNDECLVCGTEFGGRGYRSGATYWCPECDVTVRYID